jgi:hypothetical protein
MWARSGTKVDVKLQIGAAAYRYNRESGLASDDSIRVSASSNSGGNTISSITITLSLARTNREEKEHKHKHD